MRAMHTSLVCLVRPEGGHVHARV